MSGAIAIDLGATNTRIAWVALGSGRRTRAQRIPSIVNNYQASLRIIADAVATYPDGPIGICVAGQLDKRQRVVLHAPNLQWRDVALARDLEKLTGRVVVLENDVRSAALGELRYGALRRTKSVGLVVFWGSGIGGAITLGRDLVRGFNHLAGEIGHVPLTSHGVACACGKTGCFEAYAGGHVLDQQARKRGLKSAKSLDDSTRAKAVALVGQLVGGLCVALDPECVVVGGGLGLAHLAGLKAEIATHLLTVHPGKLNVVATPLGDDAGMLGAVARLSA